MSSEVENPWKANGEQTCEVKLSDGTIHKVDCGESFPVVVRKFAREAGLSKFDVYIDGREIDVTEAPNDFMGIKLVEIKKYDEGS